MTANATGHIRFNGRNYNVPADDIVAAVAAMEGVQPGASWVFKVDGGEGDDYIVWTFGAPISFHMWEAPAATTPRQ